MPSSAKRFYLCNLIPLWNIDEDNMDVDWPVYHAYFGDLIDMHADVSQRRIHYREDGDADVVPDSLRIRFEINESDFLLSGGLNDHMATYSSHADFGDDITAVRPINITDDFDSLSTAEKEQFIWIRWNNAHETTITTTAPDGTSSSNTQQIPDTLEVRCWWRLEEEAGGDVSGNPEYYYDVYIEGQLLNEDRSIGDDFDLHERSDNELEGFNWNVTSKKRPGNVEPMVDGEYVFIKMLQVMDQAEHSIHILNWKMDHMANLVLHHQFQADYSQIPGVDAASYQALLQRHKPQVFGVSALSTGGSEFAAYSASNGNVLATDGTDIGPLAMQLDHPTNLDQPTGVVAIAPGVVLILDQLRSRLMLHVIIPNSNLNPLERSPNIYIYALTSTRAFQFIELTPSIAPSGSKAGLLAIAGSGNPWNGSSPLDGRLRMITGRNGLPTGVVNPSGYLQHPTDLCIANNAIYITDTGSHRIRKVANFNPANLDSSLASSDFELTTLCGQRGQGDSDGDAATTQFNQPRGISYDSINDRLLVIDAGNHKIRAVDPTSGATTSIDVVSIDGVAGASFGDIYGAAFDPDEGTDGSLYLSESGKHRIVIIDLETGTAETLAGSTTATAGYADGAASTALFNRPLGLSYADFTLWVADANNHVLRRIDLINNDVTTIGSPSTMLPTDMPITLADTLRRKATDGVAVRVLIDDYGSGIYRQKRSPISPISITGEQVSADLQFIHHRIKAFIQNSVQELGDRGLNSFHEKMMVVDGQQGFAGGIDFDDDKNDGLHHERQHRNSLFWHDVTAFVEGKAALGLEETFVLRWMMARAEYQARDTVPAEIPEALSVQDRTDASITDTEAEMVRTFDPSPVYGFLVNLVSDEIKQILESYRRAISAARYYIYLEHQYIYYPEIGDYIATAMREHPQLQVIWCIPFFTEETQDPTQEFAQLVRGDQLITNAAEFASNMDAGQLQSQLAWHGFFRHRQMVDKFREIDASRFGEFSIRKLVSDSPPATQMIYPHSKMILCDDRFFSIGSANANGRGFTKDGELNVSCLSEQKGRALRIRLWGEHLGFVGLGIVQANGSLVAVNGHHLSPGAALQLDHPDLGGVVTRTVDAIDPVSGAIFLTGAALDPSLHRIYWTDPRIEDMRLHESVEFWRSAGHRLAVYEKVQGSHASSNSAGELVVANHLAQPGDLINFGSKLLLLDDDGRPIQNQSQLDSAEGQRQLIGHSMEVDSTTANTITLKAATLPLPASHPIVSGRLDNELFDFDPFRVKITSRSGGVVQLQFIELIPNRSEVAFDYHPSWLLRQSGGKKFVRAWEINPPEGIEYAGPGSVLFSPWMAALLLGLPWFFIDLDPDEQAILRTSTAADVRLA